MLTFPEILIGVFGAAGLLLALILLVILLPRRDEPDMSDPVPPVSGRNGQGMPR